VPVRRPCGKQQLAGWLKRPTDRSDVLTGRRLDRDHFAGRGKGKTHGQPRIPRGDRDQHRAEGGRECRAGKVRKERRQLSLFAGAFPADSNILGADWQLSQDSSSKSSH
jgi:hypothetical protein